MTRRMKASVVVTAVLWLWVGCGVVWAADGNDPNLVAHWTFDDGSGTTAEDSVGGNDGTLVGDPCWVSGMIGNYALELDGNGDYVEVADNGSLHLSSSLTISLWLKWNQLPASKYVIIDQDDYGIYGTGSDNLRFYLDGIVNDFDPGWMVDTWYHLVVTWDGAVAKTYINGVEKDSDPKAGPLSIGGDNLIIGANAPTHVYEFNGNIDDVRIYDKALTSEEVESLYEEGTSGLVAHWKLDDGSGTVAEDSAGDNDGTLVDGPVWVDGQIGGAVEFDGVDDYVEADDSPTLDGMDQLTLMAWVKTGGAGTMFVINKMIHLDGVRLYDSYSFGIQSGGAVRFQYIPGNAYVAKVSDMTVADDSWHHIAAVYTGSDGIIYIDGVEVSLSIDDTDPGGPLNDADEPVLIGCGQGPGYLSWFFDGSIDDARIYDRAVSGEEILALYEEGAGGLVAHWKFDDDSGLVAEDSAGDNDGTLVDGPVWVDGQIDGALEFDGVDDCVDATDFSLGGKFTVAMWVNPADIDGQCIIGKHASDGSNIFLVGFWEGGYHGRIRSDTYASGTRTTGWQHIVAVVEQLSPSSSDFTVYKDGELLWSHTFSEVVGDMSGKGWTIGQDWDGGSSAHRTEFFQGAIDDVRIYDKALTSEEVEALYEEGTGGLVAHWKLDEGAGVDATDSAGDNDGTLVNGPVWTSGPVGDYALEFDGVDDYVGTTVMNLDTVSICAWVKMFGGQSWQHIISNHEGPNGYALGWLPTGELYASFHINGGYRRAFSDTAVQDGKWCHVAVTYDGNDGYLYIDGVKQIDSFPDNGVITDSSVPLAIGGNPMAGSGISNAFHGAIDDVRIYSHALSEDDIYELYEAGTGGQSDDLAIAVENLQMAVDEKLRIMAELDGLVEAEREAYDALLRLLNSGQYGDLNRHDLLVSMMIIDRAANREMICADRLGILADRLIYSLNLLGHDYLPNEPPEIVIVYPGDGDTFDEFDPVVIEAEAWDNDGFVAKVEFFADEAKIGEDTDPLDGWTSEWTGGEGIYSLTAAATDNEDGFMISDPVEINIIFNNGGK